MQESSDPYVEWLGFPPGRRPANHYELLGIPAFEPDPETIAHAADCLRGQLRKVRPGGQIAAWQRLLDDLSAAKACLLDPGAKAAYDASLQGPPAPMAGVATPPVSEAAMAVPPPLAVPPSAGPPPPAPPAYAAPEAPLPPPPAPPAYMAPATPAQAFGPALGGSVPPLMTPPLGPAMGPPIGAPPGAVPGGYPPGPPPSTWMSAPAPPSHWTVPPAPAPPAPPWPPGVPGTEGYYSSAVPAYGAVPPGVPLASAVPQGGAIPQAAPSPAPVPDVAPMAGVGPTRLAAAPRRRSPAGLLAASLLLVGVAAGLAFFLHRAMTQAPAEVATGHAGATPAGAQGPADLKGAKSGTKPGKPPAGEKPAPQDKPGPEKPGPADKPSPGEKPGPADPAQPGEKPKEKPEPGEKPDPSETPQPKAPPPPKADPVKQAAWQQAVGEARVSLAEHDLESADGHLAGAAANAQTPEEHAVVERLKLLRAYLGQFWDGVRQSVATLQGGEEIIVGDTRVAVVEADQEKLIVKAAGQLRRWPIERIPASIVLPLAERWFNKNTASKVVLGAYLAVDPKGSPQRARQLWEEAARAGVDVGPLMEELDQFQHGVKPPGGAGPSKPAVATAPPPSDPAKLRAAEQLVRESYKKEYDAAETAIDKFELARKLLAGAAKTDDSPEARYVMFVEARKLAAAAGKAATACEAVDGLAVYFQVDALAMKAEAVVEAAEAARTLAGYRETAQTAIALAGEASRAKETATAKRLADLAVEAARKSNSPTLVRDATALRQQVAGGE